MREVLVFDVDGTLTPPRSKMEDALVRVFRRVVETRPVFLVTGSDCAKLRSQVPGDILDKAEGLFTCSGNELWRGDRLVFAMSHSFPQELVDFALELIGAAGYPARTGRHVEERTGTLNISVVGRNANALQRRDYHNHDLRTGERSAIARAIVGKFPEYEAFCGGQISIDIAPRGWNKARVFHEVRQRIPGAAIHFFGDNVRENGNDEPLARMLAEDGGPHRVHPVLDWRDTLAILRAEYPQSLGEGEVA